MIILGFDFFITERRFRGITTDEKKGSFMQLSLYALYDLLLFSVQHAAKGMFKDWDILWAILPTPPPFIPSPTAI